MHYGSSPRGPVRLFAVDDSSIQVFWRGLRPGSLSLEPLDLDGTPLAAAVKVDLDESGRPGAVVVDDLPSDTAGVLRVMLDGQFLAPVGFCTRPRLPGEELVRVATISDLHLGARSFGHRDTIVEDPGDMEPHPIRCARAAVDELVEWGASYLAAKGDITNRGQVPEWRTWAGLVATTPVPIDALPGNHDCEHPRSTRSLPLSAAAAAFGLSIAQPLIVRDLPGLRVVLADTTINGRNRGTLAPVLTDVLDALAETPTSTAALLLLHHQLHPWHGQEGWPRGIEHRDALDLLERIGRVHPRTLVSSGHTHRCRRWAHAGVTTTQVGSTKDYPGVWAGYTVSEGGIRQLVRRVSTPDVLEWTDRTRRAALGAWRFIGPGPIDSRCFEIPWEPVKV